MMGAVAAATEVVLSSWHRPVELVPSLRRCHTLIRPFPVTFLAHGIAS
jgi:hypothetical protein